MRFPFFYGKRLIESRLGWSCSGRLQTIEILQKFADADDGNAILIPADDGRFLLSSFRPSPVTRVFIAEVLLDAMNFKVEHFCKIVFFIKFIR